MYHQYLKSYVSSALNLLLTDGATGQMIFLQLLMEAVLGSYPEAVLCLNTTGNLHQLLLPDGAEGVYHHSLHNKNKLSSTLSVTDKYINCECTI